MAKALPSQTELIREVESLRRRIKRYESVEGPSDPALARAHPRTDWFQVLFQRCPVPYQSLDGEGCFLEVNGAWLETLGYARDEVVGRWFGDFMTEPERNPFRERFQRFKATGEVHGVKIDLVCKDRRCITVEFEGRVAYDDQGRFQQTHCVFQDITEQERAKDRLKQQMQDLERFNRLTVDREIRMVELKKEVNALLAKAGEPERYKIIE